MRSEAGYATVTVSALLFAFSVASVGYLNLTISSLRVSDRVSSELVLGGEMEVALAETIAALADGVVSIADFPKENVIENGAARLSIVVESERGKTALQNLSEQELSDVLTDLKFEDTHKHSIARAVERGRLNTDGHMAVSDLLTVDAPYHLVDCLRTEFTEHRVPAVFRRGDTNARLDGEIYRVKVQTLSAAPSVLEAIILFTGNTEEPVWVLNWDRYRITEQGGCSS